MAPPALPPHRGVRLSPPILRRQPEGGL